MLFDSKAIKRGYTVSMEGREEVLHINYENSTFPPSVEGSSLCMSDIISKLVLVPQVNRIILYQRRKYEYTYEQTQILKEIANLYNHLIKQRKILLFSAEFSMLRYGEDFSYRNAVIQRIVLDLLKTDPLGAYVELKRLIREEKIILSKEEDEERIKSSEIFLNLLYSLFRLLEGTKLIKISKSRLEGYEIGDRTIYRGIFRAHITPDFMYTRLMAEVPLDGEEIDSYKIDQNTTVSIFKTKTDVKPLYHLSPPEFNLTEDKYELIDLARNVLSEHKPKAEEFIDPDKMRMTFFNIGKDLLSELAESRGLSLEYQEIEELARILVRYTVGFGLVEVLLNDEKVQDITINGPIGQTPIFLVHQDYDECVTNIVPSAEDGEGWATKFRLISGRPLDEANPVLDTELLIPGARARVAVVSSPLNPLGLGYALRRHRDMPWTLPLFIHNKMINPLAAGLISFLIDGSRTLLVAGTRSSGKTSFLGSCLVEIMRRYRIITVEDTLELPVKALRDLGYNIQPMKVRAALASGGTEVTADEGIRTSLRMGDSSLIVGEIRSKEALALYEAMRVGALANVVAGTIHGASPYGVFDRVVNDLGVPRTSFKATDIIIVANPIKSADGMHKKRRVVSITEVRKEWEDDPLRERGFVELMKYNTKTDELELSDALLNGESEIIKDIAGNIKGWAGNWDAVWENIELRANMKKELVEVAEKLNDLSLLEAGFVIKSNDQFHRISDETRNEAGELDSDRIFKEWKDWLVKEIKRKNMGM